MSLQRYIAGLLLLVVPLCVRAEEAADKAASAKEPRAGEVVEKLSTEHSPEQEYALFLPSGYGAPEKVWPVLFVLDPRGRAVSGIDRFQAAAERHQWIIISSHQSRSDTFREVNYKALNALLLEAQTRYSVDMKRFYLAGMSGTAHASWRFGQALEGSVAGVIAAAGGVQTSTQGPPGEAKFSYYGITGTADFNYQETMELEEHLLERGIDHRIVIFEDRHGWPPHEYTERALDWMQFQAVKRGLAPSDPVLVDAELELARSAAQAAEDPIEQLRRYGDIVRDFEGVREVDAEGAEVGRLEASRQLAVRRRQEKKLASAERAYMKGRMGAWLSDMENPDRPPTLKESLVTLRIESLQRRVAAAEDRFDVYSAKRSLDNLYVQVAFYLPREYEQSRDLERLARCLEIAVAIYPSRASGRWRLAKVYADSGREKMAMAALEKAVSLGDVDVGRLKTDPSWERLRERPEWNELLAEASSQ